MYANISEQSVISLAGLAVINYNRQYFVNTSFSFKIYSINSASFQSAFKSTLWKFDLTVTKTEENIFIEANKCNFYLLVSSTATLTKSSCVLFSGFSTSQPADGEPQID